MVAWLAGVTVLSARLCAGWLFLQRLRLRATQPVAAAWEAALRRLAARLRVSRPVRLVESTLVEVPSVVGWLRPVILLPASMLGGLTLGELEALLAHELAHIRRHDYLVNLVQTALETLLFYHPAVWWASRAIRHEREACCDDIAAAACGDRLHYARALAHMEELRVASPRLAVAASGGSLAHRIARLLGVPTPQANRSAWWVLASLAFIALAGIWLDGFSAVNAQDASPPAGPAGVPLLKFAEWGPASDGLQLRLAAVVPTTDDEAPSVFNRTESYANGDELTFAVELRNAGDKPLTLLGVRYGEGWTSGVGTLNTERFGPLLFSFEVTDLANKPISRTARAFAESLLISASGMSVHELAPGKSLVVLLRPAKFLSPMDYHLARGAYRVRVTYRGPTDEVRQEIEKHWPDKPQAHAWSGEATSNPVSFTVGEDPALPELVWGEPVAGLRAAFELRPRAKSTSPDDPPGTMPLGAALEPMVHLQNVSDTPIVFTSESWRQDDKLIATDEAGVDHDTGGTWYTGWPTMVRWELKPGEIAEISESSLAVVDDVAAAKELNHPVGHVLVAKPGKYRVRLHVSLLNMHIGDVQGPTLNAQGKGDTLVTGDVLLNVRVRTAEDDARATADHFTGRVEFVGTDGTAPLRGTFTVRTGAQQKDPVAIEIHEGPVEIPDCLPEPLTIAVLAPGYEEALFQDVRLTADGVKRLDLSPATPARLRLVNAAGDPVAGAKVRYFNRAYEKAASGPYPPDDIEGPVWATSAADGTVVLDTLRKNSREQPELGDVAYYFYVEPPAGLVGRFVGGVKPGADLGDVTLSAPLEVSGEVHGTKEELDRFDAEWDQPFESPIDGRDKPYAYAVSQRLETNRDGDKLTFSLTGLRPGKLRIISNFGPQPHSQSYSFSRRDPGPADVLVEMDVTESVSGVVITPKGRE